MENIAMRRLLIILLFWGCSVALAHSQTLEVGDIKLRIGMSKQQVVEQAAFIVDPSKVDPSKGDGHLAIEDIRDGVILYLSACSDPRDWVKNPGTSLAKIQFTDSRLSYASR